MHMLLTTILFASPWSKPYPWREINHFCRKFKDSTALDHPCHGALTEIVDFKNFPGKFVVGVWTSTVKKEETWLLHRLVTGSLLRMSHDSDLTAACIHCVFALISWTGVGGWRRVLKPGKVTRTAWPAATWTLSTEGSWWGSQRHNRLLFLAVGGWSVCYWVTHHSSHQLSSPRLLVGNKAIKFQEIHRLCLETGGHPEAYYGWEYSGINFEDHPLAPIITTHHHQIPQLNAWLPSSEPLHKATNAMG